MRTPTSCLVAKLTKDSGRDVLGSRMAESTMCPAVGPVQVIYIGGDIYVWGGRMGCVYLWVDG